MADKFCGECGNELRPEDRFCPGCGKPVHETAVVPTPRPPFRSRLCQSRGRRLLSTRRSRTSHHRIAARATASWKLLSSSAQKQRWL
jgi:predicted amidophosphoribosyltransferase